MMAGAPRVCNAWSSWSDMCDSRVDVCDGGCWLRCMAGGLVKRSGVDPGVGVVMTPHSGIHPGTPPEPLPEPSY